jgi:ATP-dependent Clp protease protease subunit
MVRLPGSSAHSHSENTASPEPTQVLAVERPSTVDADPGPRRPDDCKLLSGANVRINGPIDAQVFDDFTKQLRSVWDGDDDLILELMTQGGDADIARRIALEIRIFQAYAAKAAYAVGKTAVMSAGVTVLSGFDCKNRFLTADATLLIHERHLDRTLVLKGPIESCKQIVCEQLEVLKMAERVEKEDMEKFVAGSHMTVDDLFQRAKGNCYLTAAQALEFGLISEIIG